MSKEKKMHKKMDKAIDKLEWLVGNIDHQFKVNGVSEIDKLVVASNLMIAIEAKEQNKARKKNAKRQKQDFETSKTILEEIFVKQFNKPE